jgi:BirA family biotin operon repressor/biotin-[acetyl-CoA-carboxylase] ligase
MAKSKIQNPKSRIPTQPADFDAARIERETFVRAVEVHDELPSTNDRALDFAAGAHALPALIVALRQTAGRGRGVNRWWAADGALTFSLILEPDQATLPISRWPELSLTAGGAVCAALLELLPGADLRLKWPNDVYLTGRKVCGILVEVHAVERRADRRSAPRAAHQRVVVGVGINVNNSLADAPEDVRRRATSLIDVAEQHFPLTDVLVAVLRQFDVDVQLLAAGDTRLRDRWRRLCLLSGRSVALHDGTRSIAGTCLGIDDDGALLLQTEAGPRRFFGGVVEAFE